MMKTIGLIGGMSWESTIGYYRIINQGVNSALGGLHSAQLLLHSVDFGPIETLQHNGDWEGTGEKLAAAAAGLEKAGADFFLICTNTMHKVAPQVQQAVKIPLLHIGDATAEVLVKDGISKVGLLGTAFTMEQEFYRGRLEEGYNLEVLIPEEKDREIVHSVIYNELCHGIILEESKAAYHTIIEDLAAKGAEAVILGCTEIGMLVQQSETTIRLYDTTRIHAMKAVEESVAS